MAPTVKDVESSTSTSTAALPSAQVANPAPAAARPQPIPLEVPVSVNGARTIEGSDKREPFSESTKTVLVFANGAVIRLASSVAPGQLLFVTNDKTKKEVVCQVVKSKNYRTVTGYVELEFTESAPGFWGVRIPTDSAPAAAQPKAPVVQRPVVPSAAVSPAIGTPKAAAPAPPAPVVAETNAPVAPPAIHVVAPPPVTVVATSKQESAPLPVQHAAPAPVKTDSLSAQLAAQLSALTASEPVVAPPQPAASQKSGGDASTEELRQQAARLQEQLSSLLFRESTPEKTAALAPPTPAPAVAAHSPVSLVPKEMLRGADVLEQAVAELQASAKSEVKPEVKLEAKSEPIKISSIPAPVAEIKTPTIASKTSSISLPAEEVKIPSWLAPLARETESAKESPSSSSSASTATEEISSHRSSDEFSSDISGDSSSRAQSVVFGGQLLGGSDSTETQATPSGSNKGLIFGLIAAGVLAAAGVGWYGMQPGNFLASKPGTLPVAQNNFAASSAPVSKPDAAVSVPASTPNAAAATPSSVAANNRTATASPGPLPAVDASRNSNPTSAPVSSNSAARNVPAVEEPKKPVFGDVRLTTPNVNRGANADGNVAAPAIDAGSGPVTTDPLVGLASSNNNGPSAPLPIGGDVKPAHLLKTVPPIYPATARSQRISGDVQIDALIDATGAVTTTKIISGPTLLHQAAMSAVKQWKYTPAQLDGKPTSMHLVVTVQFRLQ